MGSLSALAGLTGSSKEKGEEEALGILTSITFLNKFIDKHQLTKRFKYFFRRSSKV